jgi:Lipocalin-like domain
MTLSPRAAALPVLFVCLLAQMSFAKEGSKIVGTWKLVSYVVEVQVIGQRLPVMGEKPTGYVSFSPEGRVFLILTGEARKPAKTDQERADLLDGSARTFSRGFLLCRFSDAGQRAWCLFDTVPGRRPKTLNINGRSGTRQAENY